MSERFSYDSFSEPEKIDFSVGTPSEFAMRCLQELRKDIVLLSQNQELARHYMGIIASRMDVFPYGQGRIKSNFRPDRKYLPFSRTESFIAPGDEYQRIDFFSSGFQYNDDIDDIRRKVSFTYLTQNNKEESICSNITLFSEGVDRKCFGIYICSEELPQSEESPQNKLTQKIEEYFAGESFDDTFYGLTSTPSLFSSITTQVQERVIHSAVCHPKGAIIPDPKDVISGKYFPQPPMPNFTIADILDNE